jgi:1-acyl-sn-glycerol-3-phosphate acyltransferase
MNPSTDHPPSQFILTLRALAFWIVFSTSTVIAAILVILMFPLRLRHRQIFVTWWVGFVLWWLETTCQLQYVVEGEENIPRDGPAIVFAKHQSTWETLALQRIFPSQIWVAKRELLWIPFFGWGLALMKPIAIRRGTGRAAVKQLIRQGKERLKEGLWVIIFPEGTRVPPGQKGRYRIGGAVLAEHSGYPILPVAHNAGEFWPRHSFIKRPGTIHVRIGRPITSADRSAQEIMYDAETWIESTMSAISSTNKSTTG